MVGSDAVRAPTAEPADGFADGKAVGKESYLNHTGCHTLPAPDPYGVLARDPPTFTYDDDDDTIFKDWLRRYGPIVND
ncbi:unnamed protein product [Heligmosomoides polygyrus]|uniref:Uncharacterized protein n=1 Tax=Heligmosomoides polygyrus TaxID=6339 RepID=A0A183F353_HELPZ|nr:unnamed protein product [Heligmosomoides polygyrus]